MESEDPGRLAALLGAPDGGDRDAAAALAAALEEILAAARAAWPGVAVAPAVFVRYLAARLPARPDALAALRALRTTDLYLACACRDGDPAALAAFEQRVLRRVARALVRARFTGAFADEVLQMVRVRLLTADGGVRGPEIGDYAGHGPLVRWVQIVALRQALNLRRRRKTHGEPASGAALERGAVGPDPEIAYLKDRYAAEFSAAFQAAFAALPTRARNVVRLHFAQGLSIDQVGRLHHVHRATVARWLGRARESLLADTRRRLQERLQLAPQELDSLMDLVRSRVDITLTTWLSGIGGP